MRYRITNLSRAQESTGSNPANCAVVDIDTVQAALKRAEAYGERLYIRPVKTAADAG
ncbi:MULTISPECIES: hypothetical protein [Embleya]|uniref:Uncharacterized protein n=1 Tax=Embleya hyalina TaxID=516124 RepID=A0A401YL45_9ACTN|nr:MULTISPECIES: hypothetical protein [Embleya]GCD95317.1 hypothetical protein EHYA_02989 [Embleya hyalina]